MPHSLAEASTSDTGKTSTTDNPTCPTISNNDKNTPNQVDDSGSSDEETASNFNIVMLTDIPVEVSETFSANAGKRDAKTLAGQFTCCCKLFEGKPCSTMLDPVDLLNCRMQSLSLSRNELDMCISAKISVGLHCTASTISSHRKYQTERKRDRMTYMHEGKKICRDTFMFMHGIFKDRLEALLRHYKQEGIQPRQHGNLHRLPANALAVVDIQHVVKFVENYAEEHAILLPGRIPGYKRDDLRLLPSSSTKAVVYRAYAQSCALGGSIYIGKIKSAK